MKAEDNKNEQHESGEKDPCEKVEEATSPKRKDFIIAAALILFVVGWSVFLIYYPPEEIVQAIGINNTYLIVFLLSAIGGVSTFTSTSFYTVLVTLALGGVNPLYMAFFASIGLTLGDIVFYLIGAKGKQCMNPRYGKYISRFVQTVENISDKAIMMMIFVYSLAPLPSDLLAIVLAIAGFPLKKMAIPLFLGNFALIVALAELANYGYQLF